MAVSKKITKVLNEFEWDRGNGTVELISAGLKYVSFFVEGDWKHTHQRFKYSFADVCKKLDVYCELVEEKTVEGNKEYESDWYSATYKYLIK